DVGGYTNAPVSLTSLIYVENSSLPGAGSNFNIANHGVIAFSLSAPQSFSIRLGPDFGWGATSQLLGGTVSLAAGPHTIEIYGFAGCCDGWMQAD
ncbi:MAG: hypothetical protein FJ029_15130, partial [Actinobacteria bacterium]|nr:hypothetical protein [Actinomycetota bacterium]